MIFTDPEYYLVAVSKKEQKAFVGTFNNAAITTLLDGETNFSGDINLIKFVNLTKPDLNITEEDIVGLLDEE